LKLEEKDSQKVVSGSTCELEKFKIVRLEIVEEIV